MAEDGGDAVIGERLDLWFEARYRRSPQTNLRTVRGVAFGIAFIVLMGLTPMFLAYMDATAREVLRTLAVFAVVVTTGLFVVILPRWRHAHRDVEAWLHGDRSPEQTMRAWEASKNLTWRGVREVLLWAPVVSVPGIVHVVLAYELEGSGVLVSLVAVVLIIAVSVVIGWPVVDAYLQPLRRDLAAHVPSTEATVVPGVPVARRVTAFISVLSLLTGGIVTIVTTFGEASIAEIAVPVAVMMGAGLGSGFVFGALLVRSMLSPLEELVAVTDEVTSGHIGARALVTSNDEFGVLSVRFNAMLDRLAGALDEVRQSRARIVAASDAERKRVERNIHDGAQQRLTAMSLQLRMLETQTNEEATRETLGEVIAQLRAAHEELRDLARGLHPSILSTNGLAPAVEQLAERATVPVVVAVPDERWGETVESTAYFVTAEGLANVAKYANASRASVSAVRRDGRLVLEIVDDGAGGAHLGAGSGLTGLVDRVEAVGGTLSVDSPAGGGTRLVAELPLETPVGRP